MRDCKHRVKTDTVDQFLCESPCLIASSGYVTPPICDQCRHVSVDDCSSVKPPVRSPEPRNPSITNRGPGDHLKRLIAKMGIKPSSTCECSSHSAEMNRKGTEWCRENIDKISGWMKREAKTMGVPFSSAIAKMLIKRAIRLAEADAKKNEEKNTYRNLTRKSSSDWMVGITASERDTEVSHRSIESVCNSGYEPIIYAEPGTDLSGVDCEIVRRANRLGCWGNWIQSLRDMLDANPHASKIAIFQDDVTLCKNTKEYVDSIDWAGMDIGVLSLYTCKMSTDKAMATGLVRLSTKYHLGALAYVFSRESAEGIAEAKKWRGHWKSGRINRGVSAKAVDTFVGHQAARLGVKAYSCIPSLAQHIGIESTIKNGGTSRSKRYASTFVGEDFDAMSLSIPVSQTKSS